MDNVFSKSHNKLYKCFFELTLDLIGGKWKPLIVYYLGENGTLRYSEIKRCIPQITERMLTKQLRELEKDDIVHREVYKQIPPKVEYSLTETGEKMIPILAQIRSWGEDYYNNHTDDLELQDDLES